MSTAGPPPARRRPKWGTLAIVVALHVLAIIGLARAFAPAFTTQVAEQALSVFNVTVTTPEPEAESKPDEGASGEQGRQAKPKPTTASENAIPVKPSPAPRASSTGSETDSGARDSGEGTGASGSGSGTGSGNSGGGQGNGATRPSVRSGELNQARDFPVPEGGRQARFGKSVTVYFTVTTDGRARDCSVARSEVDAATTAAVCPLVIAKIRFNPATDRNGNPIEARYGYRVDFKPL